MNVYIFENIEQLTDYYHSGGGLVVIAKDENEVKELIGEADIKISDEEWSKVKIYPLHYTDCERKVFIFPDAGCC